ncbi:MAG: hypothetical protein HY896_06765 [Deltaproteobacteria bacterium]|nr:hypothetical protein [Deltaproteobacteria bacterium]
MKSGWLEILALAAAASLLTAAAPQRAEAITRVNGNFFLDDTYARGPRDDTRLFQGGVNLDLYPPTKKKIQARLSLRLNYTRSDEESVLNVSPVGNLGMDLSGEAFALNLQHSRFSTISSAAQLTETSNSRAALSLSPKDLPRLSASFSRTESATGGSVTSSDTASFFGDYRYKWMNFRGGYSNDRRTSGGQAGLESSTVLLGFGGSYEILPRTTLTGDYDYNRFSATSGAGQETATIGNAFRMSADTRPLPWLGFTGNYSRTDTDFDSPSAAVTRTTQQFSDVTANLDPYPFLRFSGTTGNRRFNDAQTMRSVDFVTYAANVSKQLREGVLLGASGSRSVESDPDQGRNVSDNFGVNSTMDLTQRISLRLNLNANRSESRTFVSTAGYNASGTLADRVLFDDRPPGFTYFDVVGNDLYTKNSTAIGDWVLTAHVEPVTESYSVNKSVQVNAIPTDKTNLALSYSSASSAERLDLGRIGNQNFNTSLSYMANRRTIYGLSGTVSLPETGRSSYSATGTMAYRFRRGHQMSLNYGARQAAGRSDHTFSGTLGLAFRKRVSLELAYSGTQLFREERTDFFRVRFSKSF